MVIALAIPAIASNLVTIIYNMADTFFVGQTGDPNQVAAGSLAMPIFFLFMVFGNVWPDRTRPRKALLSW
ncbi:MAG: hypothetical protein LBT14_14140 [Treponema sp.]|nr:hypothetical protein [Treponema sp.]